MGAVEGVGDCNNAWGYVESEKIIVNISNTYILSHTLYMCDLIYSSQYLREMILSPTHMEVH